MATPDCPLGLLFIDLDQFKAINDTLGHREGDKLLTDVAQRLSRLCGKREAVVRLGGDEFLFLAKEASRHESGESVRHLRTYGDHAARKEVSRRSGLRSGLSVGVQM